MMKFDKRINVLELLDADDIPKLDLYQNLKELRFINTFLGGHKVVLDGIKHFAKNDPSLSIVEIGSGGGDNLAKIKDIYPHFECTGIDLKADCTSYASSHYPNINFITSDYRLAKFTKKPDVIFNSLFCHHFTDAQLVEILQWMKTNANKGFVIADLHRHWLAYYLIKMLTQLFSTSYLVKNDAPLSVRRGFLRAELEDLLHQAGISSYKIQWKWAFRYLIVVHNE